MNKSYRDYYESPGLWKERKLRKDEEDRIETILSLLPSDVSDILDVGCGNGIVTNRIPQRYDVIGVDISMEAIKFVERKKIIGDSAHLGFQNNSFDLVLASELLEHLPIGRYSLTTKELERMSKKYILITVPYLESLQTYFTKCEKCDCTFHVNRHLRSFDLKKFTSLFREFKLQSCKSFGVEVLPYNTLLTQCSQIFGNFWKWDEAATCPQCGNRVKRRKKRRIFSFPFNKLNRLYSFLRSGDRHPRWIAGLFIK